MTSSIAGEARALGRGDADLELRLVDVARDVLLLDQLVERDRRRASRRAPDQRPPAPVRIGAAAASARRRASMRRVEALPRARPSSPWPPPCRPASAARSRRALIIGVSVNETSRLDQDRHRRRDAELVEEPARDARHERDGHEDDDQATASSPAPPGRSPRSPPRAASNGVHLLLFDEAEDVLQHHDGVVDDDADHQHQGQHGHAVEREVERLHHAEGGDRPRPGWRPRR